MHIHRLRLGKSKGSSESELRKEREIEGGRRKEESSERGGSEEERVEKLCRHDR